MRFEQASGNLSDLSDFAFLHPFVISCFLRKSYTSSGWQIYFLWRFVCVRSHSLFFGLLFFGFCSGGFVFNNHLPPPFRFVFVFGDEDTIRPLEIRCTLATLF